MNRRAQVVAALFVLGGLAALVANGPSFTDVLAAVASLRDLGVGGVVIFMTLYLVATVFMTPASWLHMASGFLFGPVVGGVFAWTASLLSGALCFLLARTRFRELVAERLGQSERFSALDGAIAREGLPLVALLRLSPIAPYNIINYVLGLSPLSLRTYLKGTGLGSLVPIALYAVIGSQLNLLVASPSDAGPAWVRIVVLGLTVVASVGLALYVKRALDRSTRFDDASFDDAVPSPVPVRNT